MFLPFLIALSTAITTIYGKKNISYAFWAVLFIVTLLTLNHHINLNLSFWENIHETCWTKKPSFRHIYECVRTYWIIHCSVNGFLLSTNKACTVCGDMPPLSSSTPWFYHRRLWVFIQYSPEGEKDPLWDGYSWLYGNLYLCRKADFSTDHARWSWRWSNALWAASLYLGVHYCRSLSFCGCLHHDFKWMDAQI